ncbi:MAG TPA: flavodoxin-dependent (E)-4-hydroxy-3-methylbut-2-enyl-diphosphate synthase, partial [Solirubrobacteraceae bacterium]|nr:flavodoxin-dependent (E)-4-hydroxy-3-methylbut-2-enyl-diphosphate synthase [Solirubrobacteraceae bacterium]
MTGAGAVMALGFGLGGAADVLLVAIIVAAGVEALRRGAPARAWVGHSSYPRGMASARQIHVGGVPIGGGAPVAVQTMTKTETANLPATMDQINKVAEAGADIVRVAVPREKDVDALRTIVRDSPIPIIADIHFNHTLALKSIEAGAHCIRLNPGNIGGPEKVGEVVD